MGSYELRAMSVGEILDGAFTLYRNSFSLLLSIVIICAGLPALMRIYESIAGTSLGVITLLSLILTSFGSVLATAAILHVISERYLGRDAALGSALRYAMRRVIPLLVAGVIVNILTLFAALFFIIPGIVVGAGLVVVTQVVVLEKERATAAIKRSWQLTMGFKGKAVILILIVSLLIQLGPPVVLGMIGVAVPSLSMGFEILGQLIGLVVLPISACAFTLFYYDLRVRKEAFDLEVLSAQLGPAPAAA